MGIRTDNIVKLKISRWIEYFNIPLHRNGLALMFSLISTSALGIAYWAVAARNFSAEEVGINSAVLSAMMLLGGFSQFGLVNFLNRFLPKAGHATKRFIVFSYLFSFFLGFISSTLFILGIQIWSPTLGFLKSDLWLFSWFVIATALWCIFALQDGVLVGLRRAAWVPVENIIFAVVKLGLLFLFSGMIFRYGIFASWTFPLIFLIVGVNILIFWQIIPKHVQETEVEAEKFSLSQIIRFIVGDYFGSLVWTATINLMPIIILELAGATANAYFYLPWKVSYILYMVSRNMGISLTVEAAKDQSFIREYSYRSVIQSVVILVPTIVVILVASPAILRIFGEGYAEEGSILLRLLALSALPNIVTSLYISIARVQRRIKDIVITVSILCGMVLLFTFLLISRMGLSGVGLAWLISQSVVATAIILTKLRDNLILQPVRSLINIISGVLKRMKNIYHKRHLTIAVRDFNQEINYSFSDQSALYPDQFYRVHHVFNTLSDMAIASLSKNGSSPEFILYLSRSKLAEERMRSQLAVLEDINAVERLGEWRELLPKFRQSGTVGKAHYWIFDYLPGIQADDVIKNHSNPEDVLRIAGDAITVLHHKTACHVKVNDKIINSWINNPIQIIKDSRLPQYCPRSRDTLDRLKVKMKQYLLHKELTLSWIQGDYWPQNILITPDGSRITGIVDWDQARRCDLPYLDFVNLFLSTRRLNEEREIGEVIVEVLNQNCWRSMEQQVWEREARIIGGFEPGIRETVLLFWLRHVSSNLTKSNRYPANPIWVLKNFVTVVEALKNMEDLPTAEVGSFPNIWGKFK